VDWLDAQDPAMLASLRTLDVGQQPDRARSGAPAAPDAPAVPAVPPASALPAAAFGDGRAVAVRDR
jgi:hypothetical protein